MRRVVALVLCWAGLLSAALLPSAAPAAVADPVRTTVTVRLAPPVITYDEASGRSDATGLVAQARPARDEVRLTFQERVGSAWRTLATVQSDPQGRAYLPLTTTSVTARSFRVLAAKEGHYRAATSREAALAVHAPTTCAGKEVVDPQATPEARCLAARLDRWRTAGLMGVGQQLNVSTADYLAPLRALSRPVPVVGFDLEELAMAGGYEFPFQDAVLADLLRLASEGAVLTASWHATNPHTGGGSFDRSWRTLSALLDDTTPQAQTFWADYDTKLALLARLQSGDGGLYPPTAVVFRPFHEINGTWFWWSQPSTSVFKRLWSRLQTRAALAGVHNLLWGFSANASTFTRSPSPWLPAQVDLGGLDSYDPEPGAYPRNAQLASYHRADRLDLTGFKDISPDVPRMALTEVGPHGSRDGAWDPATITAAVRRLGIVPAWAMLWFDDPDPDNPLAGSKQIGSLRGGAAWLRGCFTGLCLVR